MADQQSVAPWFQATADLFERYQGQTVVELAFGHLAIDAAELQAGTPGGPFWNRHAQHVYRFAGGPRDGGSPLPQTATSANVTLVEGDPLEFLRNMTEPIDLLYLDGWPLGTPAYQERHLAAYEAARPRFHQGTLILIGDSGRDHGGKAALVLPKALEDGFQVLLWGRLTLLARVNPSSVRDLVPRIGPPVPADASLDDAIRLHSEGATWEAEQLYRGILRQWPDNVSATHLLGVVRHQRGDHAAALQLIGRAIAMDPGKPLFFNNYGAALHALGREVEALACFHRALQLQSEYADALSNLGLAQDALGQDEAALASFRQALKLRPHHLDTVKRLADLLQKQGQGQEAIDLFRQAIAAKPQAELYWHLGNLFALSGRTDLAIAEYRNAIDLNPAYADAVFNLAVTYQDQRMLGEARECFDRAVGLRPERPFWRLRRCGLGPSVFRGNAEIDAYRAELLSTVEAWLAAPPPRATWNDLLYSDPLATAGLAYHGRNNRHLKQRIAAVFEPYFRDLPPPAGSGLAARRRIGFVVTQRHEGIFLRCMKGILQNLDRKQFEPVIFCAGVSVDHLRQELRRDDLRFMPISFSLPAVVQQVRSLPCDLLYYWEIGSDSLNYLMPFARLAPVQCTSHGSFLNTTGVPAVDYFLSSRLIESPAAAEHYSEKLWNSQTFLMHQVRLPPVSPVARDHFGLPARCNLYVCFQNPLKLHPDIDPLLAGILARDPNAAVVLLGGRHEQVVKLLRQRFLETVPEAWQRIALLPWLAFDDYCRLLQLADVVLDPPHYTAGSSIYDIFSFHQPLVTMRGELAVSRVTAAYYDKMGIPELVANSPSEYIDLAVRIAGDRDYRMHIRDRLRSAGDVVFDDMEAVREHERFFHEAIET